MRVSMSLVVILGLIAAAASAQVPSTLDSMIDSLSGNIPSGYGSFRKRDKSVTFDDAAGLKTSGIGMNDGRTSFRVPSRWRKKRGFSRKCVHSLEVVCCKHPGPTVLTREEEICTPKPPGDGGSPLVCPLKNDPSRYAQVGIVSWGIKCGEDRVSAVFTNVAKFRYWIDDQMASHNLDSTAYLELLSRLNLEEKYINIDEITY